MQNAVGTLLIIHKFSDNYFCFAKNEIDIFIISTNGDDYVSTEACLLVVMIEYIINVICDHPIWSISYMS